MNLLLVLLTLINVEFSWVASTGAPKGYKIGVAANGSTAYAFTDVGAAVLGTDGKVRYLWNSFDVSAPKVWVVKAYNDFGESDASVAQTVGEPAAPTALVATPK